MVYDLLIISIMKLWNCEWIDVSILYSMASDFCFFFFVLWMMLIRHLFIFSEYRLDFNLSLVFFLNIWMQCVHNIYYAYDVINFNGKSVNAPIWLNGADFFRYLLLSVKVTFFEKKNPNCCHFEHFYWMLIDFDIWKIW